MAEFRQLITRTRNKDLSAIPKHLATHLVRFLIVLGMAAQAMAQNSNSVAPAAPAESSEPAQPPFQLNELRVLGNSVLAPIEIEKTLTPFLGPNRSLKDVEAGRLALETEYHAQGYGTVYVDIPEQTVGDDGVVRLRVTEARLGRSTITGTKYFSNRQIRTAVPEAEKGKVPNLPELQAQINAVNAVTADRQVTPVLKAGAEPGTVDLTLKVQDELPLHASAELNNQYTADTSQLRSAVGLSYDNAFARQDSFSLTYQGSPQEPREVQVFAAAYVARMSNPDNRLSFSYIDSSSDVATVGDITVAGKGTYYNLDFIHSLEASNKALSSVSLGVRYKDSDQAVNVDEGNSLETPLSYASAQAAYNLSLMSAVRVWTFGASWTVGFSGVGSSREEFADKCYGCKPNFSVVRIDGGLQQKLFWGLSARVQLSGQYSVDPLVSNEQFLIGGGRNVRGYLEAEELGDVGVRGNAELRAATLIPSFLGMTFEPFVFYDAGRVSFQQPLPGQDASSSLQSVGLGFDLRAWQHFVGTLVWAEPLVDSSYTVRGEKRVQFVVRGSL